MRRKLRGGSAAALAAAMWVRRRRRDRDGGLGGFAIYGGGRREWNVMEMVLVILGNGEKVDFLGYKKKSQQNGRL